MFETKNPLLKLISAGNDIYYSDYSTILPEYLTIYDKSYFRFCDFIYLPELPEKLTPLQVITIMTIPDKVGHTFRSKVGQ